MFVLFPILIFAAFAQADDDTMGYESPEQTAAQVRACGFKHVRIVDKDTTQEQVVVVSDGQERH